MSASACPELAFPKRGQNKLSKHRYGIFRQQVFTADEHKCLLCGSTWNLCLEHVRNRSDLRLDTLANCFTACILCNQAVKDKRLDYEWEAKTRTVKVLGKVAFSHNSKETKAPANERHAKRPIGHSSLR